MPILFKLGLVFVSMVVILVAVLIGNTLCFPSRQIKVSAGKKVELDAQQLASRLGRAIQFPTISNHDFSKINTQAFAAFNDYLEETYPRTYTEMELETFGEFGQLLKWTGSDPSLAPILLMSHIDVAPVESDTEVLWTHPPFSGQVAGGYIWGRGALDVKNGVLAMLEATEDLLAQKYQPERTVYFAFGQDEEVGGQNGNRQIAQHLQKQKITLDFVLDEGGAIVSNLIEGIDAPIAFIAYAEKGYLSLKLSVEQDGGHSSSPPRQSAIGILAAAISRLEARRLPAQLRQPTQIMFDYLGPEMPFSRKMIFANRWLFGSVIKRQFMETPTGNASLRTTTATTMFSAGVQDNVLAAHAEAVINFRLIPGDTPENVIRHVEHVINDPRVQIDYLSPEKNVSASPVAELDPDTFLRLHQTVKQVFPDVIVTPCLAIHTTDSRWYASLAKQIYRFIPARMKPEDLERIHGTNERIAISNYADIVRFYIRLLQNTAP